jgi:eukaryotic-like serine/threonine-protein kinase
MAEFFGPYRLDELIGRGGMGEIYRAYDTRHDRHVALKLLPAHLAADRRFRDRFVRESRVVARLSDPHVIPIHGFDELDGVLYLDMRLVPGRDLARVLHDGPLDPARAVAIVGQVAGALDAAHADGVVHRDVKPSNILLAQPARPDAADFAYLVDFGITRAVGGADTRLTETGAAIGTPTYMAPEQFLGTPPDARVDVYALACVLQECLTGAPPFPHPDAVALMRAHLDVPPPLASSIRPGLPLALDGVLATGLAKDPADRFPSAGALAAAAEAALAPVRHPARPGPHLPTGAPPTVVPPTPGEPATPPMGQAGGDPIATRRRSSPVRSAAVVAAVVVAATVVVGTLILTNRQSGTTGGGQPTTAAGASSRCSYPADRSAARPNTPPSASDVPDSGTARVELSTSDGPIGLALDRTKAPCTVNSFLSLARQGYYDETSCHRLTTTEGLKVLQCGDPTGTGTGGPGYTVPDEKPTGLTAAGSGTVVYPRGALAMAKKAAANSGGSQFFLVYADSVLPADYTVFGTVDDTGLATINNVAAHGTDDSNGTGDGKPLKAVDIQKATVS